MAIIFNSDNKENRGRVVVLEQQDAVSGSLLAIDGWGGFELLKCIFTRVSISEQTNHQFLHTLGDRIYLYVFGDRIGALGLTGFAFHDNCTDEVKSGIVHAMEYYRAHRLVKRQDPIKVTLDPGTVLECYLHSFQAATLKTEERMYQFHMTLALLPEDDSQPNLAINTVTVPVPGGLV